MNDYDQYHLDCLSKIRHKKWELFVISRIVHGIWDEGIEYTCQQYIRTGDEYRLADICFPGLGIWCEINEKGGHSSRIQRKRDDLRMREIMLATQWRCVNFDAFHQGNGANKALTELTNEVDFFISALRSEFQEKLHSGYLNRWSPGDRYSPNRYQKHKVIKVAENVAFRYQKDALSLFGYSGGHYQGSSWQTKEENYRVWFPKLYPNSGWDNSISSDGNVITTRPLDPYEKPNRKLPAQGYRIVFAHSTNVLGNTVYRFLGVFELVSVIDFLETYSLVSEQVNLELFNPTSL